MNSAGFASFQRKAFASQSSLFGKECLVDGKSITLLVRQVDALEAAAGGFEEASGVLAAQYQGTSPPAVHAVAIVDGKSYRVMSLNSIGGERYSLQLRPTNSSK